VRFRLFGPDHLAALAVAAALGAYLVRLVRRDPAGPGARATRAVLAGALVAGLAVYFFHEARRGPLSAWDVLPLQLCDFLIFLAVYALFTLRPLACELLYFWSVGTLLAMVTPDVPLGFPNWYFFTFFTLHGAVVVSAAVVVLGFRRTPGPGAARRAFLALAAYAAVVGAVNQATGRNYLYLCRKPGEATLLDWLGPWPVYVLSGAALALGLFHLMAWPFARRRAGPAAGDLRDRPGSARAGEGPARPTPPGRGRGDR